MAGEAVAGGATYFPRWCGPGVSVAGQIGDVSRVAIRVTDVSDFAVMIARNVESVGAPVPSRRDGSFGAWKGSNVRGNCPRRLRRELAMVRSGPTSRGRRLHRGTRV